MWCFFLAIIARKSAFKKDIIERKNLLVKNEQKLNLLKISLL
jgi:hypothetical protein